jgi:hypothetical protein
LLSCELPCHQGLRTVDLDCQLRLFIFISVGCRLPRSLFR